MAAAHPTDGRAGTRSTARSAGGGREGGEVHGERDEAKGDTPTTTSSTAANSTLRTFYYEPRELTGKIHDDACHLVLGIAHDGKDGAWRFTGWKLVDLFEFRVRLKAEFQASNKELYRRELIAGESSAN